MDARKKTGGAYFILSLALLTVFYAGGFLGFQSDALYYYSVAVSIVWDQDLDLRNQYDRPFPGSPGGTVASGQYFVDRTTGKAFTLFNPGTGILMVPMLALARGIDAVRGGRHPNPYEAYYQRFAGSTSVILTAFALLLLFSILRRYTSLGAALALPPLFLFGTNWLFYAVIFAGWSHAYALFLTAFLAWTSLRRLERRDVVSAALFGLAGGALFTTRNFGIVIFVFFAAGLAAAELRNRRSQRGGSTLAGGFAAGLGFLLGAAPQLYAFAVLHGNPFRTSFAAAAEAVKPFGFLEAEPFRVLTLSNLPYLFSNLFNLENGLFVFHPLYLAGLAGAVLLGFRERRLRLLMTAFSAAAVIFWFADAAYYDNWFHRAAGSGFGHRRFLDLLPFFLFGAALIWEKARERRWSRPAAALGASLLLSCGIVLLYDILFESKALSEAKSTLFDLSAFLLKDVKTIFIAAAFYAVFLGAMRLRGQEGSAPALVAWRKPVLIGLTLAAMIVPAVLFRPAPSWERERFLPKKGFFLMHTLTPFVDLRGREWGWPEDSERALRGEGAAIGLPAPLKKGDSLLFRLRPNFAPDDRTTLEVNLGDEILGRRPVRSGDRIYAFPVEKDFGRRKNLYLKITPPAPVSPGEPSAFFVEGRVLFEGVNDPPFGYIDAPKDIRTVVAGPAVLEGWALDDRGLGRVFAFAEPEIFLAEADLLEGTRPEIGRIFVIYPDIYRTAWKIRIDPAGPVSLRGKIVRVRVIAEDRSGNRTTLGRRIFYFQ